MVFASYTGGMERFIYLSRDRCKGGERKNKRKNEAEWRERTRVRGNERRCSELTRRTDVSQNTSRGTPSSNVYFACVQSGAMTTRRTRSSLLPWQTWGCTQAVACTCVDHGASSHRLHVDSLWARLQWVPPHLTLPQLSSSIWRQRR